MIGYNVYHDIDGIPDELVEGTYKKSEDAYKAASKHREMWKAQKKANRE